MGDFNTNEDAFNALYNPYVVDLYDPITQNNSNNEFTIPLSQSLQNLLPVTTTATNNNNNIQLPQQSNTSIDISLNHLMYSAPSQQITTSVQPIYQASPLNINTTTPTSPIDYNSNVVNNNNNNLLNIYQDPIIQLQIQQLQQQLLLQQQQLSLTNVQVPNNNIISPVSAITNTIVGSPIQHQALLVPQQQTQIPFFTNSNSSNVSDNSSPDNFSYGSPSSPWSAIDQLSPTSPNVNVSTARSSTTKTTSATTTATAAKPSTTTTTTTTTASPSSKDKGDREREKEKDDRPKKKKKFDKNVFVGVDLGDELLDITSEDFQAYKNNFFANTNDKKTQSTLNYQFRKIKNRESARRSRERKATHVEELEAKIAEIEKERDNYKNECETLKLELDQYRLADKQKSANSIFDYISIGSPAAQNFSKNFSIILFLFLFGSFILTNTNQHLFNGNGSTGVVSGPSVGASMHSQSIPQFTAQQYFKGGRSPLSENDDESVEDILKSLQSVEQPIFNSHIFPEQPTVLLNRASIRSWTTLQQNSMTTLSFEKDSALDLIEKANLDKSKHNVISSYNQLNENNNNNNKQLEQQDVQMDGDDNNNQLEKENCNNNNNNNNNSEEEKEETIISRKSSSSSSPTSYNYGGTRYVNNSTLSLVVEPTSIIGQITDEMMKNPNVTTLSPGSSFKFNFLIDTQNFPNGSNDISKAFMESDNQQMTVTSVIIAIQKSPKPNTQQPNTQ